MAKRPQSGDVDMQIDRIFTRNSAPAPARSSQSQGPHDPHPMSTPEMIKNHRSVRLWAEGSGAPPISDPRGQGQPGAARARGHMTPTP